MKIIMCTNTYKPHTGGVANSVSSFTEKYRELGHKVLIIAPDFEDAEEEANVIRVPAVQNFNGSDFSVQIPLPFFLTNTLDDFNADIIHSHHPFLLGDAAQRIAATRSIPLVFTHHTMYEHYTHYIAGDSEIMQKFIVDLTIGYCNLSDHVITPSNSIKEVLKARKVTTPVTTVPTGIDINHFAPGNPSSFRQAHNIPADFFVIGHTGRLAPEKNLELLAESVADVIKEKDKTAFLVVGSGPSADKIKEIFKNNNISEKLYLVGEKKGEELVNGYHAMDLFVFASKSETQGMVLAEAMACHKPSIAIDAPGVREIVQNESNGYLLKSEDKFNFSNAVRRYIDLSTEEKESLQNAAFETAKNFSLESSARQMITIYEQLIKNGEDSDKPDQLEAWSAAMRFLDKEWQLISNKMHSVKSALAAENDLNQIKPQ